MSLLPSWSFHYSLSERTSTCSSPNMSNTLLTLDLLCSLCMYWSNNPSSAGFCASPSSQLGYHGPWVYSNYPPPQTHELPFLPISIARLSFLTTPLNYTTVLILSPLLHHFLSTPSPASIITPVSPSYPFFRDSFSDFNVNTSSSLSYLCCPLMTPCTTSSWHPLQHKTLSWWSISAFCSPF